MSNSKSLKDSLADTGKNTTSFSVKDDQDEINSEENPSRYAPTDEAVMNVQQLGAEDGLSKLFYDCIRDLYWAENQLLIALPKMAAAASSELLTSALLEHLEQTRIHVQRLEQVFSIIGREPQSKKCDAMEGLTKEGEGVVESTDPGTPARDLGVIMSSQKVEHYEISSYTGLANLASRLQLGDAADLLTQTLNEEIEADDILAGIAESSIDTNDQEDTNLTDTL